jgi:hypothetical protein
MYIQIYRLIESRRMKWAGHVECMGAMMNGHNILFGRHEGMRGLGRHRHRQDNIKMELNGIS